MLALLGVILITSSMLNMESVMLFVLVSYLTSHFSKNMNIIVGSGLLASIAFRMRKMAEGFTVDSDFKANKLTVNKNDVEFEEKKSDIKPESEIDVCVEDENDCKPMEFTKNKDKLMHGDENIKITELNFTNMEGCENNSDSDSNESDDESKKKKNDEKYIIIRMENDDKKYQYYAVLHSEFKKLHSGEKK